MDYRSDCKHCGTDLVYCTNHHEWEDFESSLVCDSRFQPYPGVYSVQHEPIEEEM